MGRRGSKERERGKKGKGKDVLSPQEPGAKEEASGRMARKWYILLAVVGLVTLVSYFNCLNNQFVFDDEPLILKNRGIRGVERIPRLLSLKKRGGSYRPIRMVSYAVDYTLNKKLWRYLVKYKGGDKGLNPFGYHVSNCIYHLITSFLVFLVVYRLVANYRIAFLAASLFALHPVHTDSVTYLAGRRDILFALFYLAGFYCFLRYRQTSKSMFIIASFLAYLLSLGSKEMGVTLPALFLCYDLVKHFPEKANNINLSYLKEFLGSLKEVILRYKYLYSSLFLGALAYSYYKIFIKSPSHQVSYYGDSMLTTFLTVGKILVYYIKLLLYPINLNADYSYNAFPLSSSFFEPATLFSFIVLGVIGYVVLRLLMHHKMLAFGVIWFFVTLLPVCHIIPHHELLAEHYLYLPSFGFCLIVAILINNFLNERRYVYLTCISLVTVFLIFSLRIVDRNRDWRNELTLWGKTIRTSPQCARAHSNLGAIYADKGMLDKAIAEDKQALIIKPGYAEAHNNLGAAYAKKGRMDEAISEYKRALATRYRYSKAHYNLGVAYLKKGRLDEAISEFRITLSIKPWFAEARNSLGIVCVKKGRLDEAIAGYKRALAINPDYDEAYYNLGIAYAKKGQLNEAIVAYKRAIAINPSYAGAYVNLGNVYYKKGELDKAISEYKRTLTIEPGYAEVYLNLGAAYVMKGDLDEAIAEYRQALAMTPHHAAIHNNLGNIYREKGRLDEAVAEYKQALAINDDFAGAHNNLAIAYCDKKQYHLAIKHCDQARKLGYKVSPKLLRNLLPYR